MKPNSSRRTTALARLATAMLVAGAFQGGPANAASFQYRHSILGLVASPAPPAQQAAAEILVALTGGPTLPAGEVNWPYSYDLKQLLSVTGDSRYNASNVSWELQSGALPAGLSLGTDGVLSGIPTTKDTVGSSFQVKATYKSKSGQQAYTIVVNGAVLHVTQIALGYSHTCAVTTDGGVKCWGSNNYGQLGDGTITNRPTPVSVSGLNAAITAVTAGNNFTCALTTGGGVKCWGYNGNGQLGNNGTTTQRNPVDVVNLTSGVASVKSGYLSSCAVTTTGGAKCWGANTLGSLGDGSTTERRTPVDVSTLTSGVRSIAPGLNHACAVTTEGTVLCWGYNAFGQLGNNSTTNSSTPVTVSGLSGVVSLTGGGNHTCALTTAGGVQCWGLGTSGQLGNNSITNSKVPVNVYGLTSGVASVGGGGYHACAVTISGGALCWGDNSNGGLGNNSITASKVPVSVTGLTSGVSAIAGAVNGNHTCALTSEGPKCWGYNLYGQVGNNTTTDSRVPVAVYP